MEVDNVPNKMPNNKSVGIDNQSYELLNKNHEFSLYLKQFLTKYFNHIL